MLAARVEPKNGPGGGCRNRGQICRFALCRVSPICVTTDHVCALSGFTKSSVNGFVLVSVKVWAGTCPERAGQAPRCQSGCSHRNIAMISFDGRLTSLGGDHSAGENLMSKKAA